MKKVFITGAVYVLPILAFAQNLTVATQTIGKVVNAIIPIVGALLLIYFFWGVAQYVSAGGDEEKRGQARNMMIYAVIGMFVAFSIFGLVGVLRNTFGVADTKTMILPGAKGFYDFR